MQSSSFPHSAVLESRAHSAGQALGCSYSSADEYEAALIAERRAEGRYGPRKYWKMNASVYAAIVSAMIVLLLIAA
jgi:hypothetical protein